MGTKRDVVKKGDEGSIKPSGSLRASSTWRKLDLPEPQDRAGFVVSGGKDGDTHSLLDMGTDGRGPLSPPKRRILIYQG
jgi:hypothetical protein